MEKKELITLSYHLRSSARAAGAPGVALRDEVEADHLAVLHLNHAAQVVHVAAVALLRLEVGLTGADTVLVVLPPTRARSGASAGLALSVGSFEATLVIAGFVVGRRERRCLARAIPTTTSASAIEPSEKGYQEHQAAHACPPRGNDYPILVDNHVRRIEP